MHGLSHLSLFAPRPHWTSGGGTRRTWVHHGGRNARGTGTWGVRNRVDTPCQPASSQGWPTQKQSPGQPAQTEPCGKSRSTENQQRLRHSSKLSRPPQENKENNRGSTFFPVPPLLPLAGPRAELEGDVYRGATAVGKQKRRSGPSQGTSDT